jgi:hypothetical protein
MTMTTTELKAKLEALKAGNVAKRSELEAAQGRVAVMRDQVACLELQGAIKATAKRIDKVNASTDRIARQYGL